MGKAEQKTEEDALAVMCSDCGVQPAKAKWFKYDKDGNAVTQKCELHGAWHQRLSTLPFTAWCQKRKSDPEYKAYDGVVT